MYRDDYNSSSAYSRNFDFNIMVSYKKQSSRGVLYEACNFIKKETLAQVLSCVFCEISNNTFLYRTPLVAASILLAFIYRFMTQIFHFNFVLFDG